MRQHRCRAQRRSRREHACELRRLGLALQPILQLARIGDFGHRRSVPAAPFELAPRRRQRSVERHAIVRDQRRRRPRAAWITHLARMDVVAVVVVLDPAALDARLGLPQRVVREPIEERSLLRLGDELLDQPPSGDIGPHFVSALRCEAAVSVALVAGLGRLILGRVEAHVARGCESTPSVSRESCLGSLVLRCVECRGRRSRESTVSVADKACARGVVLGRAEPCDLLGRSVRGAVRQGDLASARTLPRFRLSPSLSPIPWCRPRLQLRRAAGTARVPPLRATSPSFRFSSDQTSLAVTLLSAAAIRVVPSLRW